MAYGIESIDQKDPTRNVELIKKLTGGKATVHKMGGGTRSMSKLGPRPKARL